jgi:hypothetical protein
VRRSRRAGSPAGQGDAYLLALNARIAEQGEPVYVRLMAEMNQTNNAYCAFDKDGSSRGASHSTSAFKDARRRSALILRGGPLAAINAKLDRFYAQYPRKPFVFGEWAMWGADDPGFVKQLFSWVNAHKRVKMMVHNQGANPNGPFRLNAHPKARAELRKALRNPRFLATVAE